MLIFYQGGILMLTKTKKFLLKNFAFVLTALTVFTVNSTCIIGLGQNEEPASLKRFKRI